MFYREIFLTIAILTACLLKADLPPGWVHASVQLGFDIISAASEVGTDAVNQFTGTAGSDIYGQRNEAAFFWPDINSGV